MPTALDLAYVALFALVLPLWDQFVYRPKLLREIELDAVLARKRLWIAAIRGLWILVAIGAAFWTYHGRPWAALGFTQAAGWASWASLAIVVALAVYTALAAVTLRRDPQARAKVRAQSAPVAALMPRTRGEFLLFGAVALSAGFCEEFLFRAYFIWALGPWLGWWGAAALSLALFTSAHAYQGLNGALRVGLVALLYTLLYATTGSLWPGIALHALVDLNGGLVAWLALQDETMVGCTPRPSRRSTSVGKRSDPRHEIP